MVDCRSPATLPPHSGVPRGSVVLQIRSPVAGLLQFTVPIPIDLETFCNSILVEFNRSLESRAAQD